MSGNIFINYRRADAADAAGRLYDRLEAEFGAEQLFMDVDRLGAGVDFVDELRRQVAQCDVFLAVIGPSWLTISEEEVDGSGIEVRRLDNSNDWVRIEIADALARGVLVIPVLINDAPIPKESDLPEDMVPLARRNAVRLTHERFRADTQGLIVQIKAALKTIDERRAREAHEAELAQQKSEQEAIALKAAQEQQQRQQSEAEQLAQLGPERFEAMREHNNWTFIQDKNDVALLRDHLARFPEGETRPFAREQLEALIWAGLGASPDNAALQGFLEEFSDGAHAKEAREKIKTLQRAEAAHKEHQERKKHEAAAWAAVKDTDEVAVLKKFLVIYPNGSHAVETERLIRALKPRLALSRRTLVFGYGGLVSGGITAILLQPGAPFWRFMFDQSLRTFKGHSAPIKSVAFTPDSRQLVSGSTDNTLRLWEVDTGRLLRTVENVSRYGHPVAFSRDGRWLAYGGWRNVVNLQDVRTGRLIRTFKGHSSDVRSIAFSSDGRWLASGSRDETVRLWNANTGQLIRTLKVPPGVVRSVVFSPDGRKLASSYAGKTVMLWDVKTGRLQRSLKGHSDWVNSVAFSPDGKLALSGSDDNTLKLWDVASGKEIRTFKGHSGDVDAVAFSPDGRTALSGGSDSTVKLWDIASGKLIRNFKGHWRTVNSVAFSPDGNTALSGSDDSTVKLWDLSRGSKW